VFAHQRDQRALEAITHLRGQRRNQKHEQQSELDPCPRDNI
jgi:hypothetical protein